MELRLTSNEVITLNSDESLLSALKRTGIYLVASCGGKGACGKCKVNVIEGDFKAAVYGKLTAAEKDSGTVLACQTFPLGDMLIAIPKESRLVIGDQIAVSKTKNLVQYLRSYGVDINPFVKRISLDLPPPTITDNISDLERLRRALAEKGIDSMVFRHGFVLQNEFRAQLFFGGRFFWESIFWQPIFLKS